MLGELTRKDETHRGLNLAGAHGGLLVVLAKLSGLAGDTSEGVRDEGVEDGHRPLGDAGVRVDLLEDAVDVDVVGLAVSAASLAGGPPSFATSFTWHLACSWTCLSSSSDS